MLQITEDNILNEEEAFENFWHTGYNATRTVTIGEYVDDVPTELQEILVGYNALVEDMDVSDLLQQYEAQLEKFTWKNMDDVLLQEICSEVVDFECYIETDSNGNVTNSSLSLEAIDFDGDGVDEYLTYLPNGSVSTLAILKDCEGVWTMVGGDVPYHGNTSRIILDYEGKYYILSSEGKLYWWNDDAKPQPGDFSDTVYSMAYSCWNSLTAVSRETGYTPHEVYSSDTADASVDYLENIDWSTLTINDAEEIKLDKGGSVWHTIYSYGGSFRLPDIGARRHYGNDEYIYIIVEDYHGRTWRATVDKGLAVLRRTEDGQWEVAKVYYLSADHDIQIQK